MMVSKYFLCIILCLIFSIECHAVSFNCEKALSNAEKLICSDKSLSSLDDELQAVYKSALNSQPNKQTLIYSQLKWIKKRDLCDDVICIEEVYRDRIKELKSTLPQNMIQILPENIPDKFKDIVRKSNHNVYDFIFILAKERLVDEFIEQYLKTAEIKCPSEKYFQDIKWYKSMTGYPGYKAYRLYLDSRDLSTEFIWFTTIRGTAECQNDYFFILNKNYKYQYIDQEKDRTFPYCPEGECCHGDGWYTLFQFAGKAYCIRCSGNCDNKDKLIIFEVSKNKVSKARFIKISNSKIKKVTSKCIDLDVCEAVKDYIKKNIKVLLTSDVTIQNCPLKYIEEDTYQLDEKSDLKSMKGLMGCNLDIDNDGVNELACMRDFPTRFHGEIYLLKKTTNGKYIDLLNQWKNSFANHHPLKLIVLKIKGKMYLVDYNLDVYKSQPAGSFDINFIKNNLIQNFGSINIELERDVSWKE